MTQEEKLIRRIRARPPEADFGDVQKLLEIFGWTLARQKGSHLHFTKRGERTLTIPVTRGRKVKRRYLNFISERLGLDE